MDGWQSTVNGHWHGVKYPRKIQEDRIVLYCLDKILGDKLFTTLVLKVPAQG